MANHFLLLWCVLLMWASPGFTQTFVPAEWLNRSGERQRGEVRLPDHALSQERRLRYRLDPEAERLDPGQLAYLVVQGDTLFHRLSVGLRRPMLQLLTSGEVAIYREIAAKSMNQYYFRYQGQWIAANNATLRQDLDSLWTQGCVSTRNKSKRFQWQDVALIGEDVQDCLGEDPAAVYRILGPLEYRQWSVGTNAGSPFTQLLGRGASVYSLQAGVSQQYRRINRGFYLDAQMMLFQFRDRRPLEALVFNPLTFTSSTYDQDLRLTGLLLSMGIRIELAPTRKFAPFFGIGYGVLLPLADRQEITLAAGESGIAGWPSRLTVENAVITGHGSYVDFGWRYALNTDWALRLQLRLDPRTLNTDYGGSSPEAVSLLRSQESFSSVRFGNRLELWVQKQFGKARQ